MKKETWRKVAGVCGAVGLVGTAIGFGEKVIHHFKPETCMLPEEHVTAIKELINKTLDEREKKA